MTTRVRRTKVRGLPQNIRTETAALERLRAAGADDDTIWLCSAEYEGYISSPEVPALNVIGMVTTVGAQKAAHAHELRGYYGHAAIAWAVSVPGEVGDMAAIDKVISRLLGRLKEEATCLAVAQEPFELEPKHLVWTIDYAIRGFAEQIEKLELELIRHRAFPGTPFAVKITGTVLTDRERKIAECERFLSEYRGILLVLKDAKEQIVSRQAEMSAKEIIASLRRSGRL